VCEKLWIWQTARFCRFDNLAARIENTKYRIGRSMSAFWSTDLEEEHGIVIAFSIVENRKRYDREPEGAKRG
jgi:hypothetical protein